MVLEARRCIETEHSLDKDLLLALRTARGSSLCFLGALELDVLVADAPAELLKPAPGSRLCTAEDSAPYFKVRIAHREAQLQSLTLQKAPEVMIERVRSELDVLRGVADESFDWTSIRSYPEDANLFPAFEHDLCWMRATASFLAANAAPADVEGALRLQQELASVNACLIERPWEEGVRPGASHFIACALDHVSQANQRTDQDLLEEIAVAAIIATTRAAPQRAWTQLLNDFWWATWQSR